MIPSSVQSKCLPETGYVRQSQLLLFVPFSRSTLWRRVKDGSFPAPVKLSPKVTAWRVEDVRRWMAEVDGHPGTSHTQTRTAAHETARVLSGPLERAAWHPGATGPARPYGREGRSPARRQA